MDRIGRKAGWQRRNIHAAGLKFGLKGVGVGDYSDTHGGDMGRAFPVIRIRFEIKHLLRRVITLKLEGTGTQRMILLRRVAVFRNN